MNIAARSEDTIRWVLGLAFITGGVLNLLRGDDPSLSVAFLLISLVYFPPTHAFLKKKLRMSSPYFLIIILGLLVIWRILAVGAIAEGYYPEVFY